MENNLVINKCELCAMKATHSQTDFENHIHFFCEHHSLKDLNYNQIITKKESKFRKLIPLFYVFLFIFSFPLIRQVNEFDGMLYMMDLMGIFFLVFGLFKLMNLQGFTHGFQEYDFIAARFKFYGYIYPFVEIILGVMYLMGMMYLWQNLLVIVLSSIGMYTSYKHIGHADEIECVCLGTIFKLPMTWVTPFENLIMFIMVLFMMLM